VSQWDLHEERPASFDEQGWRVKMHPAEVRGLWRNRRQIVHSILLVIFLGLPWLEIDGRQALLLDVGNRQFEIFGLSLRAHNAPLLVFILAIAGFGLFLVTAIWGRVWCGWACPQTVFIEMVFRRIEKWIEGPAGERRSLQQKPWTASKIAKKSFKWIVFTGVSLVLTHSFLAYFVGTEKLSEMIQHSPKENWTSFLFIAFSTGIILFDFGWFREQFCMIACPYGRFQSVLMDSKSMIVGYDEKRGEPRRGLVTQGQTQGDCVNCYRCVQVCPTGIDIRRGVQLECIACTACVDACDEVMAKTGKSSGLIRYTTLQELGRNLKDRVGFGLAFQFTPRVGIYLLVIIGSILGLTIGLATHEDLEILIFRGKGLPYQVVQHEGKDFILNQFYAEATNTSNADVSVQFNTEDIGSAVEILNSQGGFNVRAGKIERLGFFVRFPRDRAKEIAATPLRVKFKSDEHEFVKEVRLVAPLTQ
jgi:cytochrome c oxidase accessory protein FixG